MSRHNLLYPGLLLLLAVDPAAAQERLACELASDAEPADRSLLAEFGAGPEGVVEFLAGEVEAELGDAPTASLSGGVIVRRGNRLAGADNAVYDPQNQALLLTGRVRYEDPETMVMSRAAHFVYTSGTIRFEGAEYRLGQSNARGAADVIEVTQEGRLTLGEVAYTTCPPDSNDWLIEAGKIDLDTLAGTGTARDVKLRFQGVPIFWAPYFSFPITEARKSGLLAPEVGSTRRSGTELSIPWYWNIRENYDATITPRLLTDRGLQVGSEFRYLTERSNGIAFVEYLPDDNEFNDDRYLVDFDHVTLFGRGWRGQIDLREVSDTQYFEDLGGSLSAASTTHLNRSLLFDYFGDTWSLLGRAQDYQTIDAAITPDNEPYRRLPQVRAHALVPGPVLGMRLSFDGEVVRFDRDVGVTGWRMNAAPQVEIPFERPGWFINPGVILDHTRYDLDNTLPGEADRPSRTLPITSIDTGFTLERALKSSASRVQTLEPRLLYVHVPFEDQADLPVFDTIVPDLNLVQLYRKNRFLGVDRIGDTDQLSIGITTRILDLQTGRERLSATIGQALYLSDQNVTLPGQPMALDESSDYIAEFRFLLFDAWNLDVGHQWGTGSSGTTRSEARLQYRPGSNKILNFAYRFRRDSLEQGDVSWSWPLSQSWNFVGRYNFSFRDDEALEQFYGLEYESCCWGLRLVSRRHVSTRDGTRDSSIGLQLVLKGVTSIGTSADELLERGILGYSSDL